MLTFGECGQVSAYHQASVSSSVNRDQNGLSKAPLASILRYILASEGGLTLLRRVNTRVFVPVLGVEGQGLGRKGSS